jgi:hypothetical protein
MRLTLQPNGRETPRHDPTSYIIDLPGHESAILDRIEGGGWHLTILRGGVAVNRGVFGSPHDILTLLDVEYFPDDSFPDGSFPDDGGERR